MNCKSFKCKNKISCKLVEKNDVTNPRTRFCNIHYCCFASDVNDLTKRCENIRKYIKEIGDFSLFCEEHFSLGYHDYHDELYKIKEFSRCRKLQHCKPKKYQSLTNCEENHKKILDCRDTSFRITSMIFPGARDKTHEQFMKLWKYNKKNKETFIEGYPYMLQECNKFCPFNKETKNSIRKKFKQKKL